MLNNSEAYSLTLLLTDACNMNCPYCFAQKGHTSMSWSIAYERIQAFIERYYGNDGVLNFIFMGGEPLLNFKVLRCAVEYIESKLDNGKFNIKVVTNSTMVNDEIRDWFNEHRHIRVAISSDDVAVLQTANIKNSYSKVVIVPNHIENEVKGIIEKMEALASAGYNVESVCADGVDWVYDKHASMLRLFFLKLRESFLLRPKLLPPNLLCCATWRINSKTETCRPGMNSFCVDPKGDTYACNRSSPMYNAGAFSLRCPLDSAPLLTVKCSTCSVRSLCAICPAVRASIRTDDQAKVKCLFSHESMLSSALYQGSLAIDLKSGNSSRENMAFFTRRPDLPVEVVSRGCFDVLEALSKEGWLHD